MPTAVRRSSPWILLLLLAGAVALAGCDTTAPQPERQVVVEAYLKAGAPLSTIRLSRAVGVDQPYQPEASAVEGADVAVQRLAADSTVRRTIPYTPSPETTGLYLPTRQPTIEPGGLYRLRVETPDGTRLRASTEVPGPVSVVRAENDTSVYQSDRQPSLTVEGGLQETTGQQSVFVFTATSQLDFENTPEEDLRRQLTPFYADSYDPEEDSIDTFRVTSSGLLNEGNFNRNDDGTLTVNLPWIAVAFYGPNAIALNVVDDNLYDVLRTQGVQQGGLAPGEIPNIIDPIEGGAGIFGSYAEARQIIEVQPPESRP